MSAIDKVKMKLAKYDRLTIEEGEHNLLIKPRSESGFEVEVIDEGDEYIVRFGSFHEHFSSEDEAIKFVGFGLSKRCRLIETFKGSASVKCRVEYHNGVEWEMIGQAGALLPVLFGKKREVIYQNEVLD